MMFPTHVAMGYLIGVYSRYPALYLVAGSALPDLLDRPLYWLDLMPLAHTVGHSLLVALPVGALLVYRFGERGLAFTIGWVAHIATDVLNILVTQGPSIAPFYALYPLSRPEGADIFPTITIGVPLVGITHTTSPVLFVAELGILVWALVAAYRHQVAGIDP